MVEEGWMFSDERVASGVEDVLLDGVVRCLPAWRRRRSEGGIEVRRDRSWRRVASEVVGGS